MQSAIFPGKDHFHDMADEAECIKPLRHGSYCMLAPSKISSITTNYGREHLLNGDYNRVAFLTLSA